MDLPSGSTTDTSRANAALLWAVLAGAAVALALGVYAREHEPAGQGLFTLWFSATLNMKAWLATVALVLAVSVNKFAMVTVTMREGGRALSRPLGELSAGFRVSPWTRLRHVVLPQLTPFLSASARNDAATTFAGLFAIAVMGILMYAACALIERRMTRWAFRGEIVA